MSEIGDRDPNAEKSNPDSDLGKKAKPKSTLHTRIRDGFRSLTDTFNPKVHELGEEDEITIDVVAGAVSRLSGQQTRRDSTTPFPFRSVTSELGFHFLKPDDPKSVTIRSHLYRMVDKGALTYRQAKDEKGNPTITYQVDPENVEALQGIVENKTK